MPGIFHKEVVFTVLQLTGSWLSTWPLTNNTHGISRYHMHSFSTYVFYSLARNTRWLSSRCPAGLLTVCAPLPLPSWQSLSMCWWYRGGLGTDPLWSMAGEPAGCGTSLYTTDPLNPANTVGIVVLQCWMWGCFQNIHGSWESVGSSYPNYYFRNANQRPYSLLGGQWIHCHWSTALAIMCTEMFVPCI